MHVVLLTIPYSGTNFTADLFVRRGFERCGFFDEPAGDAVYVGHMVRNVQIDKALELAQDRPLITTFRHPFRIEESARRLNNPAYLAALDNFFSQILPLNPFIVPVDSDSRDDYLQELEFSLGFGLETDWEPLGVKAGTNEMQLSDFRPSPEIIGLCLEQHQFLAQLYDV